MSYGKNDLTKRHREEEAKRQGVNQSTTLSATEKRMGGLQLVCTERWLLCGYS